jgi:hypothetical protein
VGGGFFGVAGGGRALPGPIPITEKEMLTRAIYFLTFPSR